MGREVQDRGDMAMPMADLCWRLKKPTEYCKAIILQLKISKFNIFLESQCSGDTLAFLSFCFLSLLRFSFIIMDKYSNRQQRTQSHKAFNKTLTLFFFFSLFLVVYSLTLYFYYFFIL